MAQWEQQVEVFNGVNMHDAFGPYYLPPAVDQEETAQEQPQVEEVTEHHEAEVETQSAPEPPAAPAPVVEDQPEQDQPQQELEPPAIERTESRLIAMMNQKGGVGKTTSAVNLGAALAAMGRRVLLVDLDPQAHLSLSVGLNPDELSNSIYDLLIDDDLNAADVIQSVSENLDVIPAEVNLAGAETELAPKMATGLAQRILASKVEPLLKVGSGYDFVIVDCPPSLGLLTINALVLCDEVFVPMQAHFLALQGLSKLLETVNLIRQSFNPSLQVTGVICCMHEGQTNLANEVVADVTAFLDGSRGQDVPWRQAQVLAPPIRRNIKLAESPSFGQTIFDYAPHCAGARDYERLAESVLAQTLSSG